jgi:hypothetical protein
VDASDRDMKLILRIPNGTLVKNRVGQRLTSIIISPLGENQPANAGSEIIGQSYDVQPSGATFEASALLIFRFFSSDIPADIPVSALYIALWDPAAMTWKDIGGTLNEAAGTITTQIQHLSTYALMAHTRPADFKMSNLTLTSTEVAPGGTTTANVVVTNQGDLSGNYTLSLKLDDNSIQSKTVALNGGDSETVGFVIAPDAVGEHRISIGAMLVNFVVKKPLSPAAFTVSDLTISPLSSDLGENVDVSLLLKNTGDLSGTYQVTLSLDDVNMDTREVTLDGNGSTALSFSFTSNTAGQHKVSIGDLVAPFEVKLPAPLLPPSAKGTISGPEIDSFSVAPSFDPATNKLVYARVMYKMNQAWDSLAEDSLMLTVFRDGEFMEQVPLLTLSQLQADGKTGELDYVPANGWKIGEYTFRAELYQEETLIHDTSFERITATSESTTAVVSWKTMGIIIGSVLFLGAIILVIVLYFRRDTLSDYWK